MSFEPPRFRSGRITLGGIGGDLAAEVDYYHCDARLVGFQIKATRPYMDDAVLQLSGDGTLVCTGPGTGPLGSRIQLDRWSINAQANGLDHDAYFKGWVARICSDRRRSESPAPPAGDKCGQERKVASTTAAENEDYLTRIDGAAIESSHFSIVIQGEGYNPERSDISVRFGSSPPPRIAFNSQLLGAHIPVSGAATGELSFGRTVVRVVIGQDEPENVAAAEKDALFYIGNRRTLFQTRLDHASLRVKRSTDLLDLTYGFRHYALRVEGSEAKISRLVPKPRPGKRSDSPSLGHGSDKPLLIVNFEPQYLFEEAFAPADNSKSAPLPGVRISIDNPSAPALARTRISGKSRIVFSDTTQDSQGEALLSISYLTDWSNLATVVNKRALPRTATLEDQLKTAGINRLTTRADAKEMIVANTEAPSAEETALEPVYRLILSPDSNAKWRTNSVLPTPHAPVMWSAELANAGQTAVRVLWSRDMDLSFLVNPAVKGQNLRPPAARFQNQPTFVGSLASDDRRQLAEMMSVYGIAAMRRLMINGDTGLQLTTDDPNGMVFLPTSTYCALDPNLKNSATAPPVSAPQEGFVLGKPFDESFSLKLARGATMRAKWLGEPPAPWAESVEPKHYPPFFNTAFTIDKYIHDTQDGRDTYVEVSYKGFLFPIGHRAALLKVSRREFWPERWQMNGPPIGYLIQHDYIAVRQPEKTFPAYAQPFSSFDFSPHTVTLKTVRTPDLADPMPIPGLNAVGKVFWPQLLACLPGGGRRGDVLFEYALDNGATVRSPLLFVDNAAAHDAASMQNVVQYYMGLPKPDLLADDPDPGLACYLRFAKLGAGPVRYADERTSGECTFKTTSWVLGARGWLSTSPDPGVVVTGASAGPSGVIRLTLAALKSSITDLSADAAAGGKILVYGVVGTIEANNAWLFSIVKASNPPQIDLTGSKFQNAYVSGGHVSDSVVLVTNAQAAPAGAKAPGVIRLTLDTLKRGLTDLNQAQKPVIISGVLGTTEANGTWPYEVISTTPALIDLTFSKFVNTFKTSSLAIASGSQASVEAQGFGMDAFMEGRDQPPFYPIASKARITVDKVDQLTGRPNTAIEVTFDPTFVRHGFDPATNPSEVFLDVLNPDIQFDPTANTASTGGVATTNSLLVALGRKSGLIGGTKTTKAVTSDICNQPRSDGLDCGVSKGTISVPVPFSATAAMPAAMLAPPAAAVPPPPAAVTVAPANHTAAPPPPPPLDPIPTPYNLASALAGRFDPVEFFGGALKDAKLLGVVPLKDILRAALIAAAPQLMEATDYAAAAADTAVWPAMKLLFDTLKPAAGLIASAISTAETTANTSLNNLGSGITLSLLYPAFYSSLEQLKSTAARIGGLTIDFDKTADQTTDNVELVYGLVSQFKTNVDNVAKQTKKLAQDPMPTIVQDALQTLTKQWTILRTLVQSNQATNIVSILTGTLLDPNQMLDQIFAVLIPDATKPDPALSVPFELLFGRLDDSATAPVQFPAPAAHTPPTPAQLKQQFARIIANPADVLPRLQQALFYEAFAQPFARMLASVQQLQQQITGDINWASTTLANQFTSVLRRNAPAAQNSGFAAFGWAILSDMERNIAQTVSAGQTIKLGQLPSQTQLENAARAAIRNNLPQLNATLQNWLKAATQAAKDSKDDLTRFGKSLSATAPAYQTAMTKAAAAQKCAEDFAKLTSLYGNLPQATLNELVKALSAAANQEIQSVAADLEGQLAEQAKSKADGLAPRLFDIVNNVIDTVIHSAVATTIARTAGTLTTLACDSVSDGYRLIRKLAVGLVQPADALDKLANSITSQLNDITQQLGVLQIPAGAPQHAINVVVGLRAALTRSLQQLGNVVLEFEKIRLQLPDGSDKNDAPTIEAYCKNSAQLISYVANCVDLRRRAAQAIVDSLKQVNSAIAALAQLAAANAAPPDPNAPVQQSIASAAASLTKSLNGIGDTLGQLAIGVTVSYALTAAGSTVWPDLNQTINILAANLSGAAQQAVNSTLSEFSAFVDDIQPLNKPPYTAADAAVLADKILQFTTLSDRKLAGLLLQSAPPISDIWSKISTPLAAGVATIVGGLVDVNAAVHQAAQSVLGVLTSDSGSGTSLIALSDIVSPSILSALKQADLQVQADSTALTSLQKALKVAPPDPIGVADQAKSLLDSWKKNKPGVAQLVQVVQTIVDAVTTGHFATLFNVAQLEDDLARAVAELVPARIRLNYDFDTALSDFPSGDPIFAMDPGYGPVEPGQEDIRNDLDLRAQISVNLITGERDVSATGYIRPFQLHLLGDALDLATIHFKGASFQASPGSDVKFSADIAGTEIGALLSFLEVIEDYLSPSGGNGFYRAIELVPPQIEVGYKFSQDDLVLGGLIFQNIDFSIGAILPIDGRQAEFQFALASRANPFLISAPPPTPYGGGGFIGLRATAQGVVAFEIQLEFGAIFGIQFGPLHASARITAGIYLLSEAGGYRVLQGFVQAVGEGNIACFSVAVLIQITTSQQSDSSMSGSSTYAFTFKISSFFEISYSVTASYTNQGSKSARHTQVSWNESSVNDYADADDPADPPALLHLKDAGAAADAYAQQTRRRRVTKPAKTKPRTRTVGPAMQTDWKQYRKYFAI
ncbi:hypothetical protein [Bradyrhizobium sp.]|uniref:hypothetical protein n=1 Tax=Bradyrhizobium sp. TaxID=376 RepID=UPI003C3B953B